MRLHGVRIYGTGARLPSTIVTTDELCARLGTSAQWVKDVVGCTERRVIAEGESLLDITVAAARVALDDASTRSVVVPDLVIVATCTGDAAPSLASCVQARLKLTGIAFDVNAVCNGFVTALTLAATMLKAGSATSALVIGADAFSTITDYAHRDSVFFGDGVGAVVLGWSGETRDWFISEGSSTCGSQDAFTVNETFKMQGRVVSHMASEYFPRFIHETCVKHRLAPAWYVLHPGSRVVLDSIIERLNVSPETVPDHLEHYANIAAASVPVLLHELVSQKKIQRGQQLVLAAFGAGWTWHLVSLEWAY